MLNHKSVKQLSSNPVDGNLDAIKMITKVYSQLWYTNVFEAIGVNFDIFIIC